MLAQVTMPIAEFAVSGLRLRFACSVHHENHVALLRLGDGEGVQSND